MTRRLAVALALLLAPSLLAGADADALRLRVTPALAECAQRLADAFTAQRHLSVVVEVADQPSVDGADVLLADDSELTRILEGGSGDLRTAVDLGEVPWVMVSPLEAPAPGSLSAFAASAREPVAVLGGIAGQRARLLLALAPERLRVSREPLLLRGASHALLPRTLAGIGRQDAVAALTPLTAVAVAVVASPRAAAAAALLDFLRGAEARHIFESSGGVPRASITATHSASAGPYVQAVVDWWLPGCSLAHNGYNDPNQVIGAPDAVSLGAKDSYRGIMSLGQGGWVVVDMGQTIVDGPGADVRVYQATSGEPVTLYAADAPGGPFRLVALRVSCGVRSAGLFANHCDFDLGAAGISSARYLKIEDGELYPCLAGSTLTEGADIDAVELLH